MPKIEVYADALWKYCGRELSIQELEELLPYCKAELDGEEEGIFKIELNDTNRPDLWSTAGLGRQIRLYLGGKIPEYSFFSRPGKIMDSGNRQVLVDPNLKEIRPYIAAFCITGPEVDDAFLKDLIQTQEKLCWNYGRKRKSIAMGIYRSDLIVFPVKYQAADPDKTRFVPLGMGRELSLREINQEHPKGKEFGPIVADFPLFPYLTDANGDTLSNPPVINSARIGAVEVGDRNLFIEMTGTDLPSLMLTASIVACDAADAGYTVLPVKVSYPYETPLGREVICPYYFQEPVEIEIPYANKLLGDLLSVEEASRCLSRMGVKNGTEGERIVARIPEYRNDYLHPVDGVEDIMMGRGMDSFKPVMPSDFTVGRLTPEEEFSRRVRDIMIGQGFQEMIYNYLGSRKDFIEKMGIPADSLIQISNPMTENYEFVRNSILPALLASESISGKAAYPHRIFELGNVTYREPSDNQGCVTRNYLGALVADKEAGYTLVRTLVSALFYYLSREHKVFELQDPRFLDGRCAGIRYNNRQAGFMGEVHPQILTNWGITVPVVVCEIDLDTLLAEN